MVKNAIYKVIRASDPSELGRHIVVQGGTFLNDAVLRSFELELGAEVIRPTIAGIMGAYGAALAARDAVAQGKIEGGRSGLLTAEALSRFEHKAKTTQCGLCGNRCLLTVNTFGDNRRFISGNRCERPLGKGKQRISPICINGNMTFSAALPAGKTGGAASASPWR